MRKDYDFDNALVNYVEGIWTLRNLLINTKITSKREERCFHSMLFCHTITLFDAFVGDTIRYYQNKQNKDVQEKCSYQNSKIITRKLRDTIGIEFTMPEIYDEMLRNRNYLIHRNGKLPNGNNVSVTKHDIEVIIELVSRSIRKINKLKIEKDVERIINLKN